MFQSSFSGVWNLQKPERICCLHLENLLSLIKVTSQFFESLSLPTVVLVSWAVIYKDIWQFAFWSKPGASIYFVALLVAPITLYPTSHHLPKLPVLQVAMVSIKKAAFLQVKYKRKIPVGNSCLADENAEPKGRQHCTRYLVSQHHLQNSQLNCIFLQGLELDKISRTSF